MTTITIGIMPQEHIRDRMLAIARGDFKPRLSDPKTWFPLMASMAKILSDENLALLKAIKSTQPESVSALAEATGCNQSNLSRTLKRLADYGLVELRHQKDRAPRR